ncbi:MAG TPA: DUF1826 domain-containing protein [Stellaceae bacterium]|nr:DUF1826 domain-containing protein [Stellaceae bacterium]
MAANLSVWHRPCRAGFRPLFRHLTRSRCGSASLEGSAGAIELDHLLPAVPPRLNAWRRALLHDIGMLCRVYADRAGTDRVRVKLEVVSTDGCRYFHADNIGLRLLCTYHGPGSEWVADHAVDRSALGRGGNAGVVLDPAAVRRLEPWSVGLFKGNAHPGLAGRGCVHRSPPIQQLRQSRVLLSIDSPIDD